MTNPIESTMTCEQLADVLPEFLEREVDESTRARVESHAAACDECGALLADLKALRVDAASLPVLEPSRDLWAGISARIETPVVEIVPWRGGAERRGGSADQWIDAASSARPPRRVSAKWAGLAAAGIVAITAAVTHELTKRTIVVPTPATASVSPSVEGSSVVAPPARPVSTPSAAPSASVPRAALVASKPTAEETYDLEIKRLRAIVSARRSTLDTVTVRVIEQNLKVIDDAIAQCRAALERDPASRFLLESLNNALDTKVQLLRTAAMLPSQT